MVAVRKPYHRGLGVDGYDKLLKTNQIEYFKDMAFYEKIAIDMTADMARYANMEDDALLHYADSHPKQALRIQAWTELNESGERYDRLWVRTVLYKLKKDEIAKPGKPQRMIGDLGVAASLQGFMLTKYIKQYLADHPLDIGGGECEFIAKPDYFTMKELFHKLIDPPGRFYFCYFSDDSCFSFKHKGKVYRYNVDISKCDASHGPGIFSAMEHITPWTHRDDMCRLNEQCKLPIRIVSCNDKSHKIKGRFDGPRLYSGCTTTTIINNLANVTICRQLSRALTYINENNVHPDDFEQVFENHIEACGYIVTGLGTADRCDEIEQLQFLKHSPVLDITGTYEPVLNFGVFLRASGTCKGDLPGKNTTPIEDRASSFQSSILKGMYPRLSAPIIGRFKAAAGGMATLGSDKHFMKDMAYKANFSDAPLLFFSDEELLRRYDLDEVDFLDLAAFAGCKPGYGDATSAPFVDKILQVDYQLSSRCD
jgi:hypothetical protein